MRYIRFSLNYKAISNVRFPQNPVNTFRGALGYRLIEISCIKKDFHDSNCHQCMIAKNCAYANCFATSQAHLPNKKFSNSKDIPHLMIIDSSVKTSGDINPNEAFTFHIQLFSHAINYFPYLALASSEVGKYGLGKKRAPCELMSIKDEMSGKELWSEDKTSLKSPEPVELTLEEPDVFSDTKEETISINFVTPVAFKDRATGGIQTKPEFNRIIGSLLRRYSAFQATEQHPISWNFTEIASLSKKVKLISYELQPVHWARYSTKQKKKIPIDGVIGKATYHGPIKPFLPLLSLASIIRVGRSTTFGQGKISL